MKQTNKMARQQRRKSSQVPYEGGRNAGCMTGVFHMFDFHQRFRIRKMLMDRKHGEGRRVPGRMNNQPMQSPQTPTTKKHDLVDKCSMEGALRSSTVDKTSRELKETPVAEGMPNEHHQKQRSPRTSLRLTRTTSIHHHLAIDVNSIWKAVGDPPNKEQKSPLTEPSNKPVLRKQCNICSSPCNDADSGHDHLDQFGSWSQQSVLEEKLNKARLALLKQLNLGTNDPQSDPRENQAKDFLGALELLNANKDIFLKILHDPTSISATDLQEIRGPMRGSIVARLDSFPRSGLFRRSNSSCGHKSKPEHDTDNSTPGQVDSVVDASVCKSNSFSESRSGDSRKLGETRGAGKARHLFKNIKARIKDIVKERKKERHRIAMDGVLHKIPYGQKISPSVSRTEVPSSTSSFKRAHSLNESLDKYAQLFESNKDRKPDKNDPRDTKLVGRDGAIMVKNSSKSPRRIHSLPNIASYLPVVDVQCSKTETKFCSQVEIGEATNASLDQEIGPMKSVPYLNIESYHQEDVLDSSISTEEISEPKGQRVGLGSVDESLDTDAILPVNIKDRAEFNYVKNVLSKSGFRKGDALSRCSTNLPMDPSLFLELEESINGIKDDVSPLGTEISLDHLLLFDLINEVLLEKYDSSFGLSPWFSCFKPMHKGSPILEEVWANISWHLNFQSETNLTLQPVIERDMAKDEEWMDIRYEKESLGMELEEWILDDLLDEEVVDLLLP